MTQVIRYHDPVEVGQHANAIAATHVIGEYLSGVASNTRLRQAVDLDRFADYLSLLQIRPGDLQHDPEAWRGMTWGLITGFVQWQLRAGYATGSINVRLATVKRYAELAFKAGVIGDSDFVAIKTVHGYNNRRAVNVDKGREQTRIEGSRKPAPTPLTALQRRQLKREHQDNGQGSRDEIIMCLLLDHGLRVTELAELRVGAIDFDNRSMTFYRSKVNLTQTHLLTPDTMDALTHYRDAGYMAVIKTEPLLRASYKSGVLAWEGVTRNAIGKRVALIGDSVGATPLSPHDCRHSWATEYARNHTEFELQEAGGWSTLTMPRHYVELAKISNDGKALD